MATQKRSGELGQSEIRRSKYLCICNGKGKNATELREMMESPSCAR